MPNFRTNFNRGLSVLQYILAIFMMYAGAATALLAPVHVESSLGFIYESHIALGFFGLLFFIAGAMLLYGKVRKKRRWVGRGLMAIFMCFLFSALLNAFALGFDPGAWVFNLVAAGITGFMYLRWRLQTEYIHPYQVRKETKRILD
jgi:hypothetical protein